MRKFFILITLLFIITSCSQEANFDSPIYSGSKLKIGIVGDKPKIREKNISLISLSMEDILQNKFKNLDSVFITKRYLKEAAKPQYAEVYLQSPIPFIFIESEKVYLAFIDDQLSYENAHTNKSEDYLIGFYKDTYWGLGLHNNIKNEKTIQDCYSRLFVILERFKNTGEIIID
ncbi:hypothetical protein [Neobacillus sedimentimangrovi]|jgi:hypothetical protein|uniref:hypothetical protein n=1 Tax=Neobacillus sedimentimangrovi TaxID=2699460 RepID=UPI001954F0EE|nr:hypothetical protein [Neobacillus sedimentimangrovi]